MSARSLLPLYTDRPDRQSRDRLEILTALIAGPSFDPIFREPVVRIPRGQAVYRWECAVGGCERPRSGGADLCYNHDVQWCVARQRGVGRAEYLMTAQPLALTERERDEPCVICPDRPASLRTELRVCLRHHRAWRQYTRRHPVADFGGWAAEQQPCAGYGQCRVGVCPSLANSPRGLCSWHQHCYRRCGSPGGAVLPGRWWQTHEGPGHPVPVVYVDEAEFRAWCASTLAATRPGQVNLLGLRPLITAEIQWTLFIHAEQQRHSRWELGWIQTLVNLARDRDAGSLTDLDLQGLPRFYAAIVKKMLHYLRLVYFTPAQSREAGFIETDHFGIRFSDRNSHFPLTGISQRWLRDLLWDYLADLLRSPRCPRTAGPVDAARRGITELGAFLELDAPTGGHDPAGLSGEHMERFVADQRHRARDQLPSLAMKTTDGKPSTVTALTRSLVFNAVRVVLRDAMETGKAERLGLGREFIVAMPTAGGAPLRARRPFSDEAARALAGEANLTRLHEVYDPDDLGMRDAWEAIVLTGRRVNEVLQLRWDCIGRYSGLAMLWHDQTKVGNYDAAIRIPELLYAILAERQRKTLDRFTAWHGHRPRGAERAGLALFATNICNPDGTTALTYQWFHHRFRQWVDELDLGPVVPHQARHTLATNLLRHGATLTHIRRYLGQVSDRMAEHYVHLTQSDLDDVLQRVWVAGPGTANPGQLLTDQALTALTPEQAQALAVDLARRSTPAEGGFCTFQPVVDGGACPWNLDCHNCDKFVLSGADLLYWRRKREQWRQLAEGAPDDATATYLHQYFEATARAIDGLEKALAGLGLLDDALALDLRKPQDYFHRVWSTAFRAADLAAAGGATDREPDDGHPGEVCA
jgi:integrase